MIAMSWLVPAVEIQCLCPVSKILFHFFHARTTPLGSRRRSSIRCSGFITAACCACTTRQPDSKCRTVYLLKFYSLRKRHGIRNVGGLLLVVNCPHLPTVIRGGYKGIGSSALACNRSSSHGFFKTMEAEQRLGCADTRASRAR